MSETTPSHAQQESVTLASYKPKWRPFEITSLVLVLTIPVVINLTIAESPNAWALVGFGLAGAGFLFYLGRSRKQAATSELLETSDGIWILREGTGNNTGYEQRINPNNVTSLSLSPENASPPAFLLTVTNTEGEQLEKMRIPQTLVNASADLAAQLSTINERINTGSKYTAINTALNAALATTP